MKIKALCIECKEPTAIVCLDVTGDTAGTRFQCCECEAEWGISHLREVIENAKKWEKILTWVESFPTE